VVTLAADKTVTVNTGGFIIANGDGAQQWASFDASEAPRA